MNKTRRAEMLKTSTSNMQGEKSAAVHDTKSVTCLKETLKRT